MNHRSNTVQLDFLRVSRLVVANAEEDGPCAYSEDLSNVNYFAHPEQCGSYFLCSQGTIEYLLTGFLTRAFERIRLNHLQIQIRGWNRIALMANISMLWILNVKAPKMLTVATVAGKGYTNISFNNLLSRLFPRPFSDTIRISTKWQITCWLSLQALVMNIDFSASFEVLHMIWFDELHHFNRLDKLWLCRRRIFWLLNANLWQAGRWMGSRFLSMEKMHSVYNEWCIIFRLAESFRSGS